MGRHGKNDTPVPFGTWRVCDSELPKITENVLLGLITEPFTVSYEASTGFWWITSNGARFIAMMDRTL